MLEDIIKNFDEIRKKIMNSGLTFNAYFKNADITEEKYKSIIRRVRENYNVKIHEISDKLKPLEDELNCDKISVERAQQLKAEIQPLVDRINTLKTKKDYFQSLVDETEQYDLNIHKAVADDLVEQAKNGECFADYYYKVHGSKQCILDRLRRSIKNEDKEYHEYFYQVLPFSGSKFKIEATKVSNFGILAKTKRIECGTGLAYEQDEIDAAIEEMKKYDMPSSRYLFDGIVRRIHNERKTKNR